MTSEKIPVVAAAARRHVKPCELCITFGLAGISSQKLIRNKEVLKWHVPNAVLSFQ